MAADDRCEEGRDDQVRVRVHRPPPPGPRGPRGGPQAPGMYIGSTDSPRAHALPVGDHRQRRSTRPSAAHCDHIEVILHHDGSVEVRDNGRGIPVDIEPRTGLTGVEVVFTKLHAGGKFGGGSYTASGGLHGVGASVVNALSSRLDVEVDRGGKTYAMSFRRGEPGYVLRRRQRPGPRTPTTRSPRTSASSELAVVGKAQPRGHRHPGPLLGRPADLPQGRGLRPRASCSRRARQTAFLVPGLTLVIRDERACRAPRRGRPARGGLPPRRRHLASSSSSSPPTRRSPTSGGCRASGTFTETVPVLDAKGHMTPTEVERECGVDVAVRWGTGYDAGLSSFVNIIATPKGGTHHAGVRAGPAQGVPQAARAQRPPPQGRQRQAREGRHPRRPDRRGHRAARRAAVRGPDQGGPRHQRGARDRGPGRREGAHRAAHLDQARREGSRRRCCSRRSSPR